MTIVVVAVFLNLGHEFLDTCEGAAADCLLGDEIEPDLDLIQP